MVSKRQNKIGTERGEGYANLPMHFLRALFNFAIAQYKDGNGHSILRENPVMRLTQTRAWYRLDRHQISSAGTLVSSGYFTQARSKFKPIRSGG
ncbi:hypothetical protein [Nitrosomonas ureae]|uniref:Uncharacterized protein n=1 Tax=Nitrosomonas ureae TaxID=44577 RepID=A0A0S3AHH8_9PROT|nr:hypothetical protein [Nitrosomonas ureae]ALQ50491.1 hypothetical protein ATY38_04125 [Nitrosomonas ureae]PTQ86506.1 hypothetical protein C8R28_101082 [Nitrosomonas ureae]PXX14052.1 hypothetical protein C8R27_11749 [Nitrosomonas ureae]SDT86145.1 hypothetical protein SAMN05216406_10614 [Nitrosomonas ureae]SEQ43119.1 hypothetical protein SAMN05421510_10522 [Nitrosomonas ureae]